MLQSKSTLMAENVCEEEVYKSIYFEYSKSINSFLYYKCGNTEQSKDLCQETFLKLWQNCHKVGSEKAKSYLYTLANNMFIDAFRKNQFKNKYVDQYEVERNNIETPLQTLEGSEAHLRYEKALKSLSSKKREVFLMSRSEGFTYQQIAERLTISVKAVEKRMHGALIELRKLMYKS